MRARLAESLSADLEVGARVRITGGNYRDLEGLVMDVHDHWVAVKVEFRSLTSLTVVPKNLVTFATEGASKSIGLDGDTVSLDELLDGREAWL